MEEECIAFSNTIFSECLPKHRKARVVRLSRMPSSFLWPLIISRDAYLRYAFSRYAFSRYAFSRYAISRYIFLRYAFLRRYAFSRFAVLRYAFSRYAVLRYAFSRYAVLRYAFSRYAFLRYAFSRYPFFTLFLFALCLLPLSMPFCILTSCMIPETGFCPSASV